MKITHTRLREILNYAPETGVFTRLIDSPNGRHKAGKTTGTTDKRYLFVWIENRPYLAHRVAWFWMTGHWPTHQIDHINLKKIDNRWANLREATISQNAMNRRSWSASGFKGVALIRDPRKAGRTPWQASIMKEGKRRRIGQFATAEEAGAAYQAAALELHGEFARVA